jgi:hypothetical protein
MPDNLSKEEDVAAAGGARPSETGPGSAGGSATGGGKAVPDNDTLMGGDSALGDTGSLDDGGLGSGLNSGDSLHEESEATATPKMSLDGAGKDNPGGDAPTGGLGGVSSVGGG